MYQLDAAARHRAVARARRSDHTVDLPLDPMHGTVGVAPAAFEVRSTLDPGRARRQHGHPGAAGRVDLYLGVNVRGALFALGDGHARQGEGEVCGVAVEAAMDTVLVVDLIKAVATPWPRIESDTHLMCAGCARPLEDAYRISQHDLVTWTAGLTGLDTLDAYQLISQAGQAPVGNVCDPNYAMVAKIAKRWLPELSAYDGVHARLRATSASR